MTTHRLPKLRHRGAVVTPSPDGPVVEYGQCRTPLSVAVAYAMVEGVALPLDVVHWLDSPTVTTAVNRWTGDED